MSGKATASGMTVCPRCQGSTWADGRDCRVCNATGVLTTDGEPVTYEEGMKFMDWLDEQKGIRRR